MPSLDNITTTDGYNQANVLTFPVAVRLVTVIVSNNPIMAQFSLNTKDPIGSRYTRDSVPTWDPVERRMLLASWTWDENDFTDAMTGETLGIMGIRVRSAVAGFPAQVTIHA